MLIQVARRGELGGIHSQKEDELIAMICQVGCCGVTDHSDWSHTVWGRGHPHRLPHSCCHSTTTGVCTPSQPGANLYSQGCYSSILSFTEQHATHILSLLLVTTLLHGAAVMSSFFLARNKSPYSHIA